MNRTPILFLNVLIIAACGLIYELLAGTVASYVLGDSVTQFSLIIGLYLSALGVGAWLSRFLDTDLAGRFVEVELAVALVGGLSAPLLFFGFGRLEWFPLFLVPRIGLVRTSIIFGFLNGCVGLYGTYLLAPLIRRRLLGLRIRAVV